MDNFNSKNAKKTVIEDLIDSKFVFDTAKSYLDINKSNINLIFNEKSKHADINDRLGFLNKDKLLFDDFDKIKNELSTAKFKEFLSNRYVLQNGNLKKIEAFEEVVKFFV